MSRSGPCPRCGATIAVAAPAPTVVACPACEQRCMVLVEERADGVADDAEVDLVAYREEDEPDTEAEHAVKQVVLFGMSALSALGAAVLLLFAGLAAVAVFLAAAEPRVGAAQDLPQPRPGTIAAVGLALLGVLAVSVVVGVLRRLRGRGA